MLQKIHHPPVWNRMNFLHMLACGVWPSHSHSLGSLAGPAAWFLGYQLPKKGPDLVLCFALQDVNLPETDTGKARTGVSGCGVRVSRWHCHHLPPPPVLLPWTTTKNRQSSSKHQLLQLLSLYISLPQVQRWPYCSHAVTICEHSSKYQFLYQECCNHGATCLKSLKLNNTAIHLPMHMIFKNDTRHHEEFLICTIFYWQDISLKGFILIKGAEEKSLNYKQCFIKNCCKLQHWEFDQLFCADEERRVQRVCRKTPAGVPCYH